MKQKGSIHIFTCECKSISPADLLLWNVFLPNLIGAPHAGLCQYMSCNRADIAKHIWDVHLRKTKKVKTYFQLLETLSTESQQQMKQMIMNLSMEYLLEKSKHGWRLICYPPQNLPLPLPLELQ